MPVPPAKDRAQVYHEASEDGSRPGIQGDSKPVDQDRQRVFRRHVWRVVREVGWLSQGKDNGSRDGQKPLYAQEVAQRIPECQTKPAATVHPVRQHRDGDT